MSRTQDLADRLTDGSIAPPGKDTGDSKDATVRPPDRAVALLESMSAEFERCLPSILPLDMFLRIALTGFRKTPDLLTCSRQSLMGALMDCARLGLSPCTEQASLAPFNGKVTLIVGYEGYVQLMYRSGQVEQVNAEAVLDGEEWEYSLGDGGRFFHRPNLLAETPGKTLFTYAYATLVGGGRTRIAIVRRPEALRLQRTYTRGRRPAESPWQTHFEEMWLKTALRRLQKYAPKSPEMRRALAFDGATYGDNGTVELPTTIDGEVVDTPTPPADPAPAAAAPPVGPDDDPWADIEVAQPPDART